jgi:DNA polymerase III delta prime subunit
MARETRWKGPRKGIGHRPLQALFSVTWEDQHLEVLVMHWRDGAGYGHDLQMHYFIVAETRDIAERFLEAVCEWNSELRDELMVFQGGCWAKDEDLFRDIRSWTLDNLVLRGTLKSDIQADVSSFFSAREMYDEYGIPWKRGILFVGPPGNGKTHGVKALINELGKPCLYVKSFRAHMVPDEYNIRQVFERARMVAPCVLVLEDLDSLITPENRSFFLNELDGFAANVGILTLATTNHPERLDPSILNRPSRFDRKYPFDLPGLAEREAYIALWNDSLQKAVRLSPATVLQVREETDGFSFAYLKELFLSATMRWISVAKPGAMDRLIVEQVALLRQQMASVEALPDAPSEKDLFSALFGGALSANHLKQMEEQSQKPFD